MVLTGFLLWENKAIALSFGKNLEFHTEFQAVFLDNGQVFFGKLENPDSAYPVLREVFYIRRQVVEAAKENKDEKKVNNVLVKRGDELHGPDLMYLNAKHIVMIEPVAPDSRVAQLIKESKK